MQPEARLVKQIQKYLEAKGAVFFKIHGGDSPFQEVGIPDLVGCYKGRFWAIEVKAPGGKPSRIQVHQLERIHKAGGVALVVESLQEVKDEFEKR